MFSPLEIGIKLGVGLAVFSTLYYAVIPLANGWLGPYFRR